MSTIKEVFAKAENGTLTLEQFTSIAKELNAEFKDFGTGDYISKHKHLDELNAKDEQITELNNTISKRDTDLEALKTKLTEAGNDAEKLKSLSTQFTELQAKYDNDTKNFEEKIASQAREFAVKEHAGTKQFTSAAAKRDYIEQMLGSADVKFNKKGELVGITDFDTAYSEENADAFKSEPEPAPAPAPQPPKPQFAAPTPGADPAPSKPSLSELMQAKNNNPDMTIQF